MDMTDLYFTAWFSTNDEDHAKTTGALKSVETLLHSIGIYINNLYQ